ncbi:MAG: AtpZ/AtpI family protein [Desulfobulbaceae bacterium]|nr:AtpZ/AtpI family protein [Desulfobulbaceae bacterium]
MSGFRKEMTKMMADFSTIGLTMAFSIFIGVGFGYYLDNKVFDGATKPWFTLIFLAFGVAAAFLNLYRVATRKDLKDGH